MSRLARPTPKLTLPRKRFIAHDNLFLGSKVLGELRILLRLASANAGRTQVSRRRDA
jgi:hypothetical protein